LKHLENFKNKKPENEVVNSPSIQSSSHDSAQKSTDDKSFKSKIKPSKVSVEGSLEFDIPLKIISAKLSSDGDVLCTMEWKKRYDGSIPLNSVISNKVLKSSFPDLLLEYYESRLKDNRCSAK
jgi:hypothetical protein